jgi:hypothetical protein
MAVAMDRALGFAGIWETVGGKDASAGISTALKTTPTLTPRMRVSAMGAAPRAIGVNQASVAAEIDLRFGAGGHFQAPEKGVLGRASPCVQIRCTSFRLFILVRNRLQQFGLRKSANQKKGPRMPPCTWSCTWWDARCFLI